MTETEPTTRVLLVDDEAQILRNYARALQKIGWTVDTASDGAEAVQRIRPQAYDVIVSDLSMPTMGGVELLQEVRRRDLDVPVVLMTGDPRVESAIEAIAFGAFRYLVKPVDLSEFTGVVRQAAQIHRMARVRREALAYLDTAGLPLGDIAGVSARFASALDKLWMAYQPIVDPRAKKVVAYEALLRSEEKALPHPGAILDAAERLGRLHDLGRAIRANVAANLERAPAEARIFVNLHARDLLDDELFDASSPLSTKASRVVLEITERASLDDIGDVRGRIAALRALGYGIAIDDLGAGYAGLTSFAQLAPDVVKLDMSLVRNIHAEPVKQRLVTSIAMLCAEMEIAAVAEGVETAEERAALEACGCPWLQGYLFARPSPEFVTPAL